MGRRRFPESDDELPHFCRRQPQRHCPSEHAAFFALAWLEDRPAFAGDDQHEAGAVELRLLEEADEAAVRRVSFPCAFFVVRGNIMMLE